MYSTTQKKLEYLRHGSVAVCSLFASGALEACSRHARDSLLVCSGYAVRSGAILLYTVHTYTPILRQRACVVLHVVVFSRDFSCRTLCGRFGLTTNGQC